MFENYRVFKTTFAGRELSVETGKTCGLANGSCWVRYGDTVVMVNVTASEKPREGVDFFPLSVDYEEKLYAVGKIPGSFLKREGRPSEKAILTSRVVDRPMRPLFPKDMRNDVSIVMTVLAVDPDTQPEIIAMIGASIAVSISDIPWNGPIGGISVGLVDGEIVLMPDAEQRAKSDLQLTVASSEKKVVMIEAGANEVDDDTMFNAIMKGHEEIVKSIIPFVNKIREEIGKPKFSFESMEVDHDLFEAVQQKYTDKVKYALDTDDKNIREARLQPIKDEIHAEYDEQYPEQGAMIDEVIYKLQKFIVRRWLLDEQKRVDGRGMDQMRPLAAEVGLLPRVHGSGLFTRGQTQVLTVTTLGPVSDAQKLDGLDEEEEKRYMHHYNFPSYSVGETKPSRGPGRREIGHGNLAERANVPALPDEKDFPYTIRVTSDVLESNGSTSMGSTCASSMALMNAGVPVKCMIGGVAMGLIKEGDTDVVLTDIQGIEDFLGDMDFKVTGNDTGITALQMDMKIKGISNETLRRALYQAKDGRLYIMGKMREAISEPNKDLSPYAPRLYSMTIPVEDIGTVIGPGGKMIRSIIDASGAEIDIKDDGSVTITSNDKEGADIAINMIKDLTFKPEPGCVYKGKVVRIIPIGAFVELAPGKDGMVHISQVCNERIDTVESKLNIGDNVIVKVVKIDDKGRVNLTIKGVSEDEKAQFN